MGQGPRREGARAQRWQAGVARGGWGAGVAAGPGSCVHGRKSYVKEVEWLRGSRTLMRATRGCMQVQMSWRVLVDKRSNALHHAMNRRRNRGLR